MKDVIVKSYDAIYAKSLTDLFYATVHSIDNEVYTEAQKDEWAPFPIEYEKWALRLQETSPFVALLNEDPVGFIEFNSDGYVNCFYVDQEYQNQGVGKLLYEKILENAYSQGISELYTDASWIAKSFFLKQGFEVIQQKEVLRGNQVLVNFRMMKKLSP